MMWSVTSESSDRIPAHEVWAVLAGIQEALDADTSDDMKLLTIMQVLEAMRLRLYPDT